jgi:hypothetical protein
VNSSSASTDWAAPQQEEDEAEASDDEEFNFHVSSSTELSLMTSSWTSSISRPDHAWLNHHSA